MKTDKGKHSFTRYFLFFLLTSIATYAYTQDSADLYKKQGFSGNPVFPGWYADPDVVIHEKRYWIFPTYSDKFEKQVFMDAFSSPDLVNWIKHSHIIDTAAVRWAKLAMWAPASVYKDGKYYLFFAANDVHPGEVGGIGVAVAEKPEGPYSDYLGKPLVDTIVNGAQPIDQAVFRDSDGSWYMYYGGWQHCNIVKLKDDFTGLLPFNDGSFFKEVTPENYVEGPMMFKRKGIYYFMWSEGSWTKADYSVAYAMGTTPLGPFKREAKILQQDPLVGRGAGHHSVLNLPGTDKWFIVYHRRPLSETDQNARVTCIEEMNFDDKGKILPVKLTFNGVKKHTLR